MLPDGSPFRWRAPQRSIARDMFEPGVAQLFLRLFSGFGKTFTLGAGFAYGLVEHAARCGVRFPNEGDGEEWLAEELKPVIGREFEEKGRKVFEVEGIRAVRDVAKMFRLTNGGRLSVFGTSPGKTRRAQLNIAMCDEIDAMPDIPGEGDPVFGFFGRTREQRMQRRWAASYPSIIGASRIDSMVQMSQSLFWLFNCLGCGELWKPHRRHLVYETVRGEVSGAWIACPRCSERFDDSERREMSERGAWFIEGSPEADEDEWLPDDPETRRSYRAYTAGCMISLGQHDVNYPDYLHEVAAKTESLKTAKNPTAAARVIVNQLDSESFRADVESKPEPKTLWGLRESDWKPGGEIPEGVLAITAGVDPNKEFIALEIVGHGLNDETWGLGYEEIRGNIFRSDTWAALESVLQKRFEHPQAGALPISMTCIDSRYQSTKVVKPWCAARRRMGIVPIVGSNQLGSPFIGQRTTDPNTKVKFVNIGTHEAKDIIYQRLELRPESESEGFPQGFMHFPRIDRYGVKYFEELTAEDSAMKRSPLDGQFYRFFELPAGKKRNEPLDVRVYAMAARQLLNPNLPALAKSYHAKKTNQSEPRKLGPRPRKAKAPASPEERARRRRRIARRGPFRGV